MYETRLSVETTEQDIHHTLKSRECASESKRHASEPMYAGLTGKRGFISAFLTIGTCKYLEFVSSIAHYVASP